MKLRMIQMYDEEFLAELEGRPDKNKAFKEFISKKEVSAEELDDVFGKNF
jgi:hypothetical protein